MKNQIIEHFKKHPHQGFDIQKLSSALNITQSEDYKELAKSLNALESDYRIIADKHHRYRLIESTTNATGVLDVKAKGFAFCKLDHSTDDDIYIPKHKIQNAMHKDRVLIDVQKSPRGLRKEGSVVKVITRHITSLVGTVSFHKKKAYLIPDERNAKGIFAIVNAKAYTLKPDDKIVVNITRYNHLAPHEVTVTHVIGSANQPKIDILSKIFAHNIDPIFPHHVLQEADKFQTIKEEDLKGRVDLRERMIVTIDGEDAKDFDDAIEVRPLEDGTYQLGVHIADVSHYVTTGSHLDKEAYRRGTSIYLVDRVIPMLPENLSNHMCSLIPNTDRLTMSCEMIIDKEGKVTKHTIFPSVIQSKARLTYQELNTAFTEHCPLKVPIELSLEAMRELAHILNHRRASFGSINFETDESAITLNTQGEAIDVYPKTRGEAERMIEEFMLIANKTIAEHIAWMNLPFIYRIHGKPEGEKLERLLQMIEALDLDIKAKHTITHKELQKLLQLVENTASEKGVNTLMLRAMNKAIYSEHNVGHFGLAFDHYTHFTSPIRRYPDLIVHRLLKAYLIDHKTDPKHINHFESTLPLIAENTSVKERKAIDLERDILDMKKAEYMSKRIGKTYQGIITSIAPFGLYITLPNTVEGLLHISDLDDDHYTFDETLLRLMGKESKTLYKIGDRVKIKVSDVDIFEGEVDFKLIRRCDDETDCE